MHIVLLRFSGDRVQAGRLMEGHKAWLQRGFDDGAFLLAGSLLPGAGGGILVQGLSLSELEARVNDDPLVAEGVVTAEILELAPSKVDPRLGFLLG